MGIPAELHFGKLEEEVQRLLEITRTLPALLKIAEETGVRLYLVGGFVRDVLLGLDCNDMDLATESAEDLGAECRRETGAHLVRFDPKFGSIRLIPPDVKGTEPITRFDVSPLRGTSIDEDLRQRDFTVNAVAVDLLAWKASGRLEFIDPLGGLADLQAGLLRACSYRSFADDPLRTLRAYRLLASYRFTLDSQTKAWLLKGPQFIDRVAVERIRDELVLILAASHATPILRMLDEDGLLDSVLPECQPMRGLRQNGFHHLDVWGHSLLALENLETLVARPGDLFPGYSSEVLDSLAQRIAADRTSLIMLKLAVLVHDIGKPACQSVDDQGTTHFYTHEVAGARLAVSLCSRLRFSKKEIEFVGRLVREHMRAVHLSRLEHPSSRALSRFFRLGPTLFWPLLLLYAADYLATLGTLSAGGDMGQLRERLCRWLDFYHQQLKPREKIPPLLNGRDLMSHMDLSPGPLLGKLLRVLTELQWEGRINSREEALREASRLVQEWRSANSTR